MIKKRWFLLLFSLASLFSWVAPQPSYACSYIGLGEYQLTSQNGQFIYLIFKPDYKIQNIDLYTKYKNSGLYRNDGTTERFWTAGNVAPESVISNDGRHLIELNGTTVSFYRDGQKQKTYFRQDFAITAGEVRSCGQLYEKNGQKVWNNINYTKFDGWTGYYLDEPAGKFYLDTFAYETYIFDLNGSILEQRENFNSWLLFWPGLPIVVAVFLFYKLYRRWRRNRI